MVEVGRQEWLSLAVVTILIHNLVDDVTGMVIVFANNLELFGKSRNTSMNYIEQEEKCKVAALESKKITSSLGWGN